jgi:hypothetical protein
MTAPGKIASGRDERGERLETGDLFETTAVLIRVKRLSSVPLTLTLSHPGEGT